MPGFTRAMGYTPYSAASIGECYYAADLIKKRGETFGAWVTGWKETAMRTEDLAIGFEKEGSLVAAGRAYLRAWNYYRAAEFAVMPQGSQEQAGLYRDSIRCLDKGFEYGRCCCEKIIIPYESTTLPVFSRLAPQDGKPRTTIVLNGGGDGAGEEMYFLAGAPQALDYGFNVLVFHGPGQRGALHQDPKLFFRPDWEKVLGPVLDYCQARPDVDMARLGVYGVSLGGFMVPRAAAFDKRIKALAVNAILPNYFKHWLDECVEQVPGVSVDSSPHGWKPFRKLVGTNWSIRRPKSGTMRALSFRLWTGPTAPIALVKFIEEDPGPLGYHAPGRANHGAIPVAPVRGRRRRMPAVPRRHSMMRLRAKRNTSSSRPKTVPTNIAR